MSALTTDVKSKTHAIQNGVDVNNPEEWPKCRECKTPIDGMAVFRTSKGYRFVFRCHGDERREVVTYTYHEAMADRDQEMCFGPGFVEGEPMVQWRKVGRIRVYQSGTLH